MYGLEAINAHNGWAVSVVGVTIVFSGLTGQDWRTVAADEFVDFRMNFIWDGSESFMDFKNRILRERREELDRERTFLSTEKSITRMYNSYQLNFLEETKTYWKNEKIIKEIIDNGALQGRFKAIPAHQTHLYLLIKL